jgi:hypothetical protein
MTFKTADEILTADPRFASLCVVDAQGARLMDIYDHHRVLHGVDLAGRIPLDVRQAFDRARNALLYAYFDYDLLVVGEVQAFGAFELALKHRLHGHGGPMKGTLRKLVDQARKAEILPKLSTPASGLMDPIEALIALRNGLSHGTAEIHSPAMAIDVLEACVQAIDTVYPA